jgi:hypothetical protein
VTRKPARAAEAAAARVEAPQIKTFQVNSKVKMKNAN